MPTTETAALPQFKKFFLLEKWDEFKGIATGIATAEKRDRDNEELVYDESKPYFEAWSASVHKDSKGKSYGNLRMQHDDKKVAGKLNSIEFNDDAKLIRVEAKVVDPVAKEMLSEGCLTGFSIGGSYVKKYPANKDGVVRYVADPVEISVVDRPALPEAVFQSVKADGTSELRKFARYEKSTGDSFNDIQNKVQSALDSKLGASDRRWIWIRDCYADSVVYCVRDVGSTTEALLYECSYSASGDDVTLGDAHEVKQTYVPVDEAEAGKAALADLLKSLESGDIQRSNEEISELLKSLETELEKTDMADKNKDGKEEVLTLDKAARHSVHQKIAAAKAAHTKHMEACKAHHDAMHAHMDGISKVLGGGPESTHEDGEAEHVTEGRGAGAPQASGASETADKGAKTMEFVSIGKDEHGVEIFKRAEAARPLTTADLPDLAKAVLKGMLEIQKGAIEQHVGDRKDARPFVKAVAREEDKGAAAGADDGVEKMSDDDWKAYAQGDQKAIRKAQRCTANKWTAVPSRIMNREAARVGSN